MAKKLSKEIFVQRAKEIHGDKYDYSEFEYVHSIDKSKIKCNTCGHVFYQSANAHLGGHGCPKCWTKKLKGRVNRVTYDMFVERSREKHGDKYEYTPEGYENGMSMTKVYCKKHKKWFKVRANQHMLGKGCPDCMGEENRKRIPNSLGTFIKIARMRYGDKYDYSKAVYVDNKTPLEIICKEHGSFWQRPDSHLKGYECPFCGKDAASVEYIKKAIEVHGFRYDYARTTYKGDNVKSPVICNTCGYAFWIKPSQHLIGEGCLRCHSYGLLKNMQFSAKRSGLAYEEQKSFDFLGDGPNDKVDYYFPEINTVVECQGDLHFQGEKNVTDNLGLDRIVESDKRKYQLLREHGIDVIYYCDEKNHLDGYIGPMYHNVEALFNELKRRKL